MALALCGISVSKGIAIGTAYILQRGELEIPEYNIASHLVQAEIARYRFALEVAVQQLKAIRNHIPEHTPPDIAAFIDTHLLMLDDPTLTDGPVKHVKSLHCNAEYALKIQRDTLVGVFDEMDDPYLRTRKDDVIHVINCILRVLLNRSGEHHTDKGRFKGRIIVTDDLSPADTILMQHQETAAIVSEQGGPTSHTAILARSLGIPALVGVKHARQYINHSENLIVDGQASVIIADPGEKILKHYHRLRKKLKKYHASLRNLVAEPAVTFDHKKIELQANVELPEDLPVVKKVGAAGVGLFRTEFLFMNRSDLPNEHEQYRCYKRVVQALKGAPVTIRTLDLGADKQWCGRQTEENTNKCPALGMRAIRWCLKEPALFLPQLRAILRVSAYGSVRLMIPMLSNLQEVQQVLSLIDQAKLELRRRHIKYDRHMAVGCMIETPAAALLAKSLTEYMHFFSIGTNDLIQYTLAIDRIDNEVSYLYDPLHPAVLQLVNATIQAGLKANIPVSLCGEMAGETRYTRLLLGMGLTEFSMHPSSLLEVKRIILNSDTSKLSRLTRKILKCSSSQEVVGYLDEMNRN